MTSIVDTRDFDNGSKHVYEKTPDRIISETWYRPDGALGGVIITLPNPYPQPPSTDENYDDFCVVYGKGAPICLR